MNLHYRPLETYEELLEAARLQGEAWTAESWTSAVQLKAAVMHGGSVIAAFDGERPVGFCYGFAAFDGRRRYLHSHMMVVHSAYRDRGIGMRLKAEQRRWALEFGYDTITWTYDPFQLRNAHLNLHKLGGTAGDYFRSVYGTDASGDPSDRFLIRWELDSPRVRRALDGQSPVEARWASYAALLGPGGEALGAAAADMEDAPGFLLAVPKRAAELKAERPEFAIRWKLALRERCEEAFRRGWRVVGMLQGDERAAYYVLERAERR